MIALDTNVLVRFLVEDDKAQTAAAVALVKRAVAADEGLFVTDIVLCEVVWVLRYSYEVPRLEIVHAALASLRSFGEEPHHGDPLRARTKMHAIAVALEERLEHRAEPFCPHDRGLQTFVGGVVARHGSRDGRAAWREGPAPTARARARLAA